MSDIAGSTHFIAKRHFKAWASPWSFSFYEMCGPDAEDFLARMTTVDIKKLTDKSGRLSFFLDSTGKIQSAFWLWRTSKSKFYLEVYSGGRWEQQFNEFVEKFTFAEDFKLERKDWECLVLLAGPTEVKGRGEFAQRKSILEFRHDSTLLGQSYISAWGAIENIEAWKSEFAPAAIEGTAELLQAKRIRLLQPALDSEITTSANPVELGLYKIIDSDKGCYPGQEVIEKIVNLGSPARKLMAFRTSSKRLEIGEIATADGKAGTITSLTESDDGFLALAMISRKFFSAEQIETSSGATLLRLR